MTNVPAGTAFDVIAANGRSTVVPQRILQAQAIVMRNAGGKPNRLAMNSTTLEVLQSNTWMGEGGFYSQPGPALGPADAAGRTLTHPKLPGYSITIDENYQQVQSISMTTEPQDGTMAPKNSQL